MVGSRRGLGGVLGSAGASISSMGVDSSGEREETYTVCRRFSRS